MTGRLLWFCLTALFHWGTVRAQEPTRSTPEPTTVLPSFSTPFIPQQGACSAWEQIAGGSNGLCTVDSSCSHLQCNIAGNKISFGVLPCADPLALSVVVTRDGSVLYNNSFSESEVIPVTYSGITLSLNITVIPAPDQSAITIGVIAVPPTIAGIPSPPITLIPDTTIPVDRTQCYVTGATPSDSTQPSTTSTPSGTPPHAQTCEALERIASSSSGQCSTSQSCTTVNCNLLGGQYHMVITVLPCDDPPDIRFVVHDSSGDALLNETLSQSRDQPIQFAGVTVFHLIVNITHTLSPDAIVLGVYTHSEVLGDNTLIPSTSIPLDRSNCTSLVLPTGTTPSPPPPVSETCRALQQIQSSSSSCVATEECTSVLCDFLLIQANLTVLPCREPPAIGLKVTSGSGGTVLLNDVLTRSRLENVTVGGTTVLRLNVSIRHTSDAILLKIDGISPTGDVTPLVPETRIPIDRCDCPGVECVVTTSSGGDHSGTTTSQGTAASPGTGASPGTSGGSDHTSSHGGSQQGFTTTATDIGKSAQSSQLVKIVVPVIVVVVLLVLVVIVLVVVGVVYSSKKRARAYTFHRMTFSNVNDQDEEED